jgi:sulfoxide reductase heme-binding subunit YedZ
MRLWKAIGDASLILLIVSMALGPLARLWRPAARVLPWRREAGIWFGILALVHTVLILNGWARWSIAGFFGYEFVPQLGRVARMEPGFGLANLLGLIAVVWTLPLMATSADWAVNRLGPRAWKWLHNATYTIFWLVVAHVAYFLFIHYTRSFHRDPPAPDWFQLPFVALAAAVVLLQMAAFGATVRRRRRREPSTR